MSAGTSHAKVTQADLLRQISEKLTVMLASATPLTEGDEFVGYQIKTGALHSIIGLLVGAGVPVTVPMHEYEHEMRIKVIPEIDRRLREQAELRHEALVKRVPLFGRARAHAAAVEAQKDCAIDALDALLNCATAPHNWSPEWWKAWERATGELLHLERVKNFVPPLRSATSDDSAANASGGRQQRLRVMADEVLNELKLSEHGWSEEDTDRIQASLLPRVYDLLNLLAMAES